MAAREEGGGALYLNQRDCKGNAAQWELTLRAGREKQSQGQHGNITFSHYKAAMSCGKATGSGDQPENYRRKKETKDT